MPAGVVDLDGLARERAGPLARAGAEVPFDISKIGHVVLRVADLQRSVDFYTQVLGFHVTDVYPETMMDGRMVFLRCGADHHSVALIGGRATDGTGNALHHFAFEVGTLDEVLRARAHLERHGVAIDFEGRRRAGCQVAVEFRDPDGNGLEIFWGLDRIGADGAVRPAGEWRETASLEAALDDPPAGQDTSGHDPALRRARPG